MIKVIENFLPKPIFNNILNIVESEQFDWKWHNETIPGDGNFMFNKVLYVYPFEGRGEIFDKELLPLFGIFKDFQDEHLPEKSKTLAKLKLNLYPNQGKQVKHGKHFDITTNRKVDPNIITSVFNFHTCNGYTCIEKEDGSEEKVPSVANSIVIFDNALHYGVTQSDIPRRIVLNINVLK